MSIANVTTAMSFKYPNLTNLIIKLIDLVRKIQIWMHKYFKLSTKIKYLNTTNPNPKLIRLNACYFNQDPHFLLRL